jgi:hypothetical protein
VTNVNTPSDEGITWDTQPASTSSTPPITPNNTQSKPDESGITWDQPDKPKTGLQNFTEGLTKETGSDWDSPMLGGMVAGAVKKAAEGLGGILNILNNTYMTPLPESVKMQTDLYKRTHPEATGEQVAAFGQNIADKGKNGSPLLHGAVDWLHSAGQPEGFWQNVGGFGEQMLELMGPAEFTKLASAPAIALKAGEVGVQALDTAAHIKQAGQVADFLRANKKIAGLVGIGLKASQDALLMGGQNYAHTEDPKQAAIAAGIGGVGGAVTGAAGKFLEKGSDAATTMGDLGEQAKVGPTSVEANTKLGDTVNNALAPEKEAAQGALDTATNQLENAAQSPKDLAANAPENSMITAQAQKAAKSAHAQLGADYEKASNSVKDLTKGTTVEYGGSPLHQAAQDIAAGGKAADVANPLNEPLKVSNPGSPKVNDMVEKLADEEGTFSLNDEGEPKQLTAENLLDTAKNLKEKLRATGWATSQDRADRDVYHQLIQGVHDTLQQVAEKSGNPEVVDTVKNMNTAYKEGITRFKNPDVQALLNGNVNDVAKRLLGGATSVADIKTAREALGKEAFGSLMDSSLGRMAADSIDKTTGEFSFKNFLNKWNTIPAEVRQTAFKDSLKGGALQNAVNQAQKVNASGVIPESTQKLKDVAGMVNELIGPAKSGTDALLKDPARVQQMASVVGPEGMAELGKTIIGNQLREAATKGVEGKIGLPDTGKMLNWISSFKDSPETVNALFKPTPESEAAYNKLITSMSKVQSVKNAIKYGVITPALVGTGAAAGHTLGSALLGGLLAGGSEAVPAVKNIVENIANHPNTWASLGWLGRAANGSTASTLATGAKLGASLGANAVVSRKGDLSGAMNSLSGNQ